MITSTYKPFTLISLLALLLLAGCYQRGLTLEDVPTPITPDAYATEIVLTQNAPPQGFGEVKFPMIDDNLLELAGWHYTVDMEFEGVFAQVPRETSAHIVAEVWYNQIASARRVLVTTSGDLLGQEEASSYEAVQLGPDAFLVQDGACMTNARADAEIAVSVGAGSLVGGLQTARASGQSKQKINNETVWRYNVNFDQLNLPSLNLGTDSKILAFTGELWVAPEHNAVVRYYMTIDVENAQVLNTSLPVTGRLIVRYDLYDIGVQPNISVPFGC